MSTENTRPFGLQVGYKLGYYKSLTYPGLIKEALIQIEILESSKVCDERSHEIFDYLKTDLCKINKIEAINGDKIENVFISKRPELKYDVKVGELIRFKHSEFKEILPDISYIAFYTTKTGALNNLTNIHDNIPLTYTGSRLIYYKNGKIKDKYYYVNGLKMQAFGYYNNDFNSLQYSWTYNRTPGQIYPTIREYVYDKNEQPTAQYKIQNKKIIDKCIYDKSGVADSLYILYGMDDLF